jgi:GH24 family phage-related lysozyme (muramidase)
MADFPWDQVVKDLSVFEGRFSYMYLDTVGCVTVGVGKMLPDAAAARKLPFVVRATGSAATADDIASDFASVKKQTAGLLASKYKPFTKIDLPDTEIDKLLLAEAEDFDGQVRRNFSGYDDYPVDARRVILDMAFNLGMGGLLKFKKFKAAAEAHDWATAAAECKRGGIQQSRNDWAKNLLLEVAQAG